MKYIIVCLFFIPFFSKAQNDSIDIELYSKYSQIKLGLSFASFSGNISTFTKHGGSFDLLFSEGREKYLYGFNAVLLGSDKIKEFTTLPGYKHYQSPAFTSLGLFYGKIFGNSHKSHFQGVIGINYAWLFFQKKDDDIDGFKGIVPQFEFSRLIRLGESKYSYFSYVNQYTPPTYDPRISNNFIEIFAGYKHLMFNGNEGNGGIFTVGIRYVLNKHYIE